MTQMITPVRVKKYLEKMLLDYCYISVLTL